MNNTKDFAYAQQAYANDESILVPYQHEISFDAYLIDLEYLAEPNRYGEYVATVQPLDMGAIHMVQEAGERALTEVLMRMGNVSLKEPRPAYETREGLIISSQLFAPKLNVDPTDTTGAFFQQSPQVSVRANFHDRKDGMVYLHLQYVDFYERTAQPWEVEETDPDKICYLDF